MFNVNNVKNFSILELQACVETLALHIKSGKDLAHIDITVNESALQALDQQMANPPPDKVIEDLHVLLLTSLEKGLDKTHNDQLDTIRQIRQQFLTTASSTALPGMDVISQLTIDAQKNILFQLSPLELASVKLVQKLWNQIGAETQISLINDAQIPLVQILIGNTAEQAISWLKTNPACKSLRYADLSKKEEIDDYLSKKNGFNNECLQELVKICPKLTHLHITNSSIKGDALKNLQYTKTLQSLDIERCDDLDPDALNYLQYTPTLLSLNILGCKQFGSDALKNLQYTTALQSLKITYCMQLEPDALKNLLYTTVLQRLNISGCYQLEPDALKNLQYTKALQRLDIGLCKQLDPDALKNLQYTTALQSLNITACHQLEPDALKNLQYTTALQSLNITACHQLDPDALENLRYTKTLQSLNFAWCKQFESDALKNLQYTPTLLSLNIFECKQLEPDALKHLKNTPSLLSLDISYCTQIKKEKIPAELAFLINKIQKRSICLM